MNPEISTSIAAFFYPALIGIVGFFLVQFYIVVTRQLKEVSKSVNEILVKLAAGDQKFESHESRIRSLEEDNKELRRQLEDFKFQVLTNKK